MFELAIDSSPQPAVARSERTVSGRTVVVVDGNEVIRLGLVTMLRSLHPTSSVVACAPDPDLRRQLDSARPDLVVASSSLDAAEMDVLEDYAARRHIRILLILGSERGTKLSLFSSRYMGGVVPLDGITPQRLKDALDRLHRGEETLVPARLAHRMVQDSRGEQSGQFWRQHVLTQRELQVLALVSKGYSNKQIAPRVGISEHGVKRHVANILAKLNCANRAQAVAFALKQGILESSTEQER
jgi:DNA-binding NarL/FixJ family response regulator